MNYDLKVLAIGGDYSGAVAEELNYETYSWRDHAMSPVDNFNNNLIGFTTISLNKSLFIFGDSLSNCNTSMWNKNILGGMTPANKVLEWDGASWHTMTNELCTGRQHHKTIIYAGKIYHMGECSDCENRSANDLLLFKRFFSGKKYNP